MRYRAEPDYEGPDALAYRICNTDGLCDTANVTITVTED
ncbi:MAG: Ig-like domain-containing protein [Acidimicrobiales bacterium]